VFELASHVAVWVEEASSSAFENSYRHLTHKEVLERSEVSHRLLI
jgi:hypothetical protein